MSRMRKFMCLAVLAIALPSSAQKPEAGNWDLGVYAGGGTSVPGGTRDVQLFSAGIRLGKVLTGDHGPGLLRGNFEYAVEGIPVFVVFQNGGTYGAGFDPVILKWNFANSRRAVPFLELTGGTLFSSSEVPAGTSSVNFRTGAGLGFHIFGGGNKAATFEVKYEHISNAGLATPNPGINTVQFRLGLNRFK